MMSKKPSYPFRAKSTAYLRPGQFWAIDLAEFGYGGWYGCGRVLELDGDRRYFLAGVMNWVDTKPPTSESLAGHFVISQTVVHVRWIDADILGHRALEEDGLEPLMWLGQSGGNHSNPNKRPDLMRGLVVLREATKVEHQELGAKGLVMSWGAYVSKGMFEPLVLQRMGKHGHSGT